MSGGYQLIDLSQDIYQGMKVYPGHLKTVVFDHMLHEETASKFEGPMSYQTKGIILNDNGPTHVDSFSHLDPDPSAESIDQMSLDLFYGPAKCIDVSGVPERTDITPDHLDEAEQASGTPIEPGDIVLFHTAYTWHSLGRYLLAGIGVYIVLGILLSKPGWNTGVRTAVIVTSTIVMASLNILFAHGFWIV